MSLSSGSGGVFVDDLSAHVFARFLSERHSTRAFLPTPINESVLHDLLMQARLAPSGANLQPGRFIWVRGEVRQRLSAALHSAWQAGAEEVEDYSYFPRPMPMTWRRRQVAAAQALYGALSVARDDRIGREAHFGRNFSFFDAPVALLVTMEHEFGTGGYMDLGMTLYGLMLAAHAQGLASCVVGALASYPNLIRQQLQLDDKHRIVCGVALGYADPAAPVNQTRTTRCALAEYFHVLG